MKLLTMVATVAVMLFQTSTYNVSWYGGKHQGRKTANGEIFDKGKFTCAAVAKYRFGEKLKVTNKSNGKSVIVKVNDRGGFAKYGRELDLSEAAFKKIASVNQGVAKVSVERL